MDYEFRRQDVYVALILAAASLFVVVESWRMPRQLQNWPVYAGPGVVTGLLGLVLFGMAVGLLVRALRSPGAPVAIRSAEIRRYLADPRTRRLGLVALVCTAYLLLLGRGLPYLLTTGAYLVVAMLLFRAARWWVVLLVGATVTAAIAFVFNRVFLIPLP